MDLRLVRGSGEAACRRRRGLQPVLAALVAIAVTLMTAGSTPASAQAGQTVTLSGSFTGTGALFGGNVPCTTPYQPFTDGQADVSPLGDITFRLDYCLEDEPAPTPWPAVGVFSVTAADGTLMGD